MLSVMASNLPTVDCSSVTCAALKLYTLNLSCVGISYANPIYCFNITGIL